jgi:hypothetical protein
MQIATTLRRDFENGHQLWSVAWRARRAEPILGLMLTAIRNRLSGAEVRNQSMTDWGAHSVGMLVIITVAALPGCCRSFWTRAHRHGRSRVIWAVVGAASFIMPACQGAYLLVSELSESVFAEDHKNLMWALIALVPNLFGAVGFSTAHGFFTVLCRRQQLKRAVLNKSSGDPN